MIKKAQPLLKQSGVFSEARVSSEAILKLKSFYSMTFTSGNKKSIEMKNQ